MKKNNYIIRGQVIAEPTREDDVKYAIIKYVHKQYPGVEITGNVAADIRIKGMKPEQYRTLARKATQNGYRNGMPDLQLSAARRGYSCLRIESKKHDACPFTLKGELRENEHIHSQAIYLAGLREHSGALAVFCWGLVNHVRLIDWYMNPNNAELFRVRPYSFTGSNGYTPEICTFDYINF